MLQEVLSGSPGSVMPLIEDVHHAEWRGVVEALRGGDADLFVRRVFEQFGPRAFVELLRRAIGALEVGGMEGRQLRLEAFEGLAQACMRLYGADDERTLSVRAYVFEMSWTTYENPVVAASAMYKRVQKNAPSLGGLLAKVLGHAYLSERQYERALESYRIALKTADEAEKAAIERRELTCLIYLGRFREARELSRSVLARRGAVFSGGDVVTSAPSKVEAAGDELRSILDWAGPASAELARGLGVLSERLGAEGRVSDELDAWFEDVLEAVRVRDKDGAELNAVMRQALERGAPKTALAASAKLKELVDPATVAGQWVRFNHGALLAQQEGFDEAFEMQAASASALKAMAPAEGSRAYVSHARMLLDQGQAQRALDALDEVEADAELVPVVSSVRDAASLMLGDEAARKRVMGRFIALNQAGELASQEGEYLVGLLVQDALGRGDETALELQRGFLEAVRARFEGGPPVWMERVNLAGLHAQFGQLKEAAEMLRSVVADQEKNFGPKYADAILTRTMLAQVLEQLGDTKGAAEQRALVESAGAPMAWEPVKF